MSWLEYVSLHDIPGPAQKGVCFYLKLEACRIKSDFLMMCIYKEYVYADLFFSYLEVVASDSLYSSYSIGPFLYL